MKLPIFPTATLVATLALSGCATPPAQVLDGMEATVSYIAERNPVAAERVRVAILGALSRSAERF